MPKSTQAYICLIHKSRLNCQINFVYIQYDNNVNYKNGQKKERKKEKKDRNERNNLIISVQYLKTHKNLQRIQSSHKQGSHKQRNLQKLQSSHKEFHTLQFLLFEQIEVSSGLH